MRRLLFAALVFLAVGQPLVGVADSQTPPPTSGGAGATASSAGQALSESPVAAGELVLQGSVSCGSANRGALANSAQIEDQGVGFVRPETWRKRGFNQGTDELVELMRRVAAKVASDHPGAVLGIADLSKPGGGAVRFHRSHQSGRDVDLLYYALDDTNQPMVPDNLMPVYTSKGRAYYSKAPTWRTDIPVRYFDLARNWALVAALIADPGAEVTHIFVARAIKSWLLKYAAKAGAPAELIARARVVLSAPRNASSHNDHAHVRIACSSADIRAGRCRNENAPHRKKGRWTTRVRCPRPPPVN